MVIEKLAMCKDPRYRSLQLHLGQKTTMLGPHVRASDSSIYKVLTVRSSYYGRVFFSFFSLLHRETIIFPKKKKKKRNPQLTAGLYSDH